jgi:hypothetical protein
MMTNDRSDRAREDRAREDRAREDRLRGQDRSERERAQHESMRTRTGGDGGRGFFERAGDEISSWFGDEDAERRREYDDRASGAGGRHEQGRYEQSRSERSRQEHPREDYRPYAGDYGRAGERYREERESGRGIGGAIGAAAGAMFGGSSSQQQPQRDHDPHYREWRQRQIDALDNDYDEYRREHQSKFDNDFSSWRGHRQTKRQILAQVREHMDVVGSDDQSVGKVDMVRGDKIILTKDSQGGVHKSLGCTAIDRIEGDKLILAQPADEAKRQLVEERGLDERNAGDERMMQTPLNQRSEPRQSEGPRNLERSFSGTYPRES